MAKMEAFFIGTIVPSPYLLHIVCIAIAHWACILGAITPTK